MAFDAMQFYTALIAWPVLALCCVAQPILRFIRHRRLRLRPLPAYPSQPGVPPRLSQPFPTLASLTKPAPLFFWSPIPDLTLPVWIDNTHRNWTPDAEAYLRLIERTAEARGGMIAVPRALASDVVERYNAAHAPHRLKLNQDDALRPDSPAWLYVVPIKK